VFANKKILSSFILYIFQISLQPQRIRKKKLKKTPKILDEAGVSCQSKTEQPLVLLQVPIYYLAIKWCDYL